MSTAVPHAVRAPAPVRPGQPHPSLLGILRAELIKVVSLRSAWWVMAATVALITLVSLALAWSLADMAGDPATAPDLARTSGAELVAGGFRMGMVTIAVLGALLITGEYSTGMIRSTLAAVPSRLPVLAAKSITLTTLTAAVSVIAIGLSYVVTAPLLSRHDLVPALSDPATWWTFAGTVFFLIVAGLFSLGAGTLLRSSAGTITVALLVLLVLPGVLSFISIDWIQTASGYLPLPASESFLGGAGSAPAQLSAGTGIGVVAAYAVVPVIAGAAVLQRRDAC